MRDAFERPLLWVGSSKKDLLELPAPVRRFFGHALDFAQRGEQHGAAKVLNVFACPMPTSSRSKSSLTVEIVRAICERGLTQPKVSALLKGEFSNFSERKLMDCLNRLGYDIEIRVLATEAPIGHLVLSQA